MHKITYNDQANTICRFFLKDLTCQLGFQIKERGIILIVGIIIVSNLET